MGRYPLASRFFTHPPYSGGRPENRTGHMARILITDDSTIYRMRIARTLKLAGHDVHEAGNGLECLEALASGQYDIVFIDLLMPEMDGIETLGVMKEKYPDVPTVVLSADIQETTRDRVLGLGARDFLSKPPNDEALLGAIEKFATQGTEI